MEDDAGDLRSQKRIFKALNSELRLQLLQDLASGPVSAPALSEEYDVTAETLVNNLNELEDAGFVRSREVRGPGGRPRKEFSLLNDGVKLSLEIRENGYEFRFDTSRSNP